MPSRLILVLLTSVLTTALPKLYNFCVLVKQILYCTKFYLSGSMYLSIIYNKITIDFLNLNTIFFLCFCQAISKNQVIHLWFTEEFLNTRATARYR